VETVAAPANQKTEALNNPKHHKETKYRDNRHCTGTRLRSGTGAMTAATTMGLRPRVTRRA
jgi:hypothetical protein